MAASGDWQEFHSAAFRRGKAVRFGLVIVVLGVLLVSMANSVVNGVVEVYMGIVAAAIVFLGVGLVRAFSTGITLTDEEVVARTTYSTKRWRWETLERARAKDAETRGGPLFIGRSMSRGQERIRVLLVLHLKNGLDDRVYGLQMVATAPQDSEWLDDAVTEINRRLAAREDSTATPS